MEIDIFSDGKFGDRTFETGDGVLPDGSCPLREELIIS
jgi:hypothetical protein